MTLRRWSLQEVKRTEWWAVDEPTGTAYHLDDDVATSLWERHELVSMPLQAALVTARSTSGAPCPFVDLRFVGTTVRYRSEDDGLVERVSSDFAGAKTRLRRSPDVLVDLKPGADVERLHRAVSGDRRGVTISVPDMGQVLAAATEVPVLPPLQLPRFTGRFCALHGALLAMAGGYVAVCGRQRAGKTTTAVLARRDGLAEIVADELVLVDLFGHAAGVALPLRQRTSQGRVTIPLDPTEDGAPLTPLAALVVLAEGDQGVRLATSTEEAIRLVAPHLRHLGGDLGTTTRSALSVVRRTPVWEWCLRPWPDLADDIAAALRSLGQDLAQTPRSAGRT